MGHDFKGSLWSGELFLSVTTFSLSIDLGDPFTPPKLAVKMLVACVIDDSVNLIPDEPFSFLEI